METGKEDTMENKNTIAFAISILVGVVAVVSSLTYYHIKRDEAIKSNIESAIVKGIDPVAVRCAYSDQRDVICVAYAATIGKK
jgi:hypothetical protein